MFASEFIRVHKDAICWASGVTCDIKQAVYYYQSFWMQGIQYIVEGAIVRAIH